LPDEAAEAMGQQLTRVLDYVSQLDDVQLPADAEPFFGAIDSVNAVRDDVTAASFPRETILQNAPDTDGEFYRVPPVFK
jgi:aspartyl-tRNA(Asn)/glutamyl-tRNA(Gln) amidotransferase subunit C